MQTRGTPITSIQNMTTRRRNKPPRRNNKAAVTINVGPGLVVAMGTAAVLLLWFLAGAFFYLNGGSGDHSLRSSSSSSSSSLSSNLLLLPDFPADLVDVWPDNNIPPSDLLTPPLVGTNCLPSENAACRERLLDPQPPEAAAADATTTTASGTSKRQRIGLLRPPGVWGDIFEDFVVQYVEMSRTGRTNMDLISTSHVDVANGGGGDNDGNVSFTKILRPAVLPLVLAAVDLALYCGGVAPQGGLGGEVDHNHNNADDANPVLTSVDHLLDVVRQVVRWHCRLTHVAKDTALLTLPMDQLLAVPMQIEKDLVQFLDLRHEQQKDLHVDMETLARRAFARIDESSKIIQTMDDKQRIQDGVQQIVAQETASGMCHLNPFLGDSIASTHVTEIVGHFMDGTPIADICALYPTASFCNTIKADA